MQSEKLIQQLIEFAERSEKLLGKNLKISQAITIESDNFDRHFTCFSNFEFKLKHFMIRTSGQIMMFEGDDFNYEIATRNLIEFQMKKNEYTFLEKLSDKVYKRSMLSFA